MTGRSFIASDVSAETIFFLFLQLCEVRQAKLGEPKKSNPRKLVLHQLLVDLFLGELCYRFYRYIQKNLKFSIF